MITDGTILSRWLTLLGVRHTAEYTDNRFRTMPFPTLFGLSVLLREYNVETHGYKITDKAQLQKLSTPFIAPVNNRFVIVTGIDGNLLHYCTVGVPETIPVDDFMKVWSGVAFTAVTSAKSAEPGYGKHRLAEAVASLRNYGLWIAGVLLFAWFFITRGDIHNWGTVVLPFTYMFGLWLSFMLIGKDLGVKSKKSDAVCNILQPGGCDRITKSDASTFLGVFHWSEVGFTYFSVGLITMVLFPQFAPWLAGINVCALPYTVWSISYQKFVAKTWCTMCVGVQLTLWVQFVLFLCSGLLKDVFPLEWNTLALIMVYGFVLFAVNKLNGFIKSRKNGTD